MQIWEWKGHFFKWWVILKSLHSYYFIFPCNMGKECKYRWGKRSKNALKDQGFSPPLELGKKWN